MGKLHNMDKLLEETMAAWAAEGEALKTPEGQAALAESVLNQRRIHISNRVNGLVPRPPRQLNGGVWIDHPGLGMETGKQTSTMSDDEIEERIKQLLGKH